MLERLFYVWHIVVGKAAAPFKGPRASCTRAYWTAAVKLKATEAGSGLRVNGPTLMPSKSVRIGDNCHFNGMVVHGRGGLTIGDNFHSGRGCKIITVNHNWASGNALPYDSTVVERPVTIGENVWFGDDVLVLPGAAIGEGVVVGAGSVVTGRVEPLAVIAGNPARAIKHRDSEHYEKLKSERRFH